MEVVVTDDFFWTLNSPEPMAAVLTKPTPNTIVVRVDSDHDHAGLATTASLTRHERTPCACLP